MRADDITRAVLARDDVARYLRGVQGVPAGEARQRIEEYLVELRTTQRYRFYRALQHPLYPILRKVRRVAEGIEHASDATRRGRVVYVSNHKSHLDYLVEPLVLDDHGVRPPLMAAGINLFGGALGLLHRHVTGAIPIRRNSKDPVYLVTLRAYVAEILKIHDLLYYAEGGRSYSGELKSPKTGLLKPRCSRIATKSPSCRWRWRTISSSKIASSRARPHASARAPSPRKSENWCGTPSATDRARLSRSARRSACRASMPIHEPTFWN